MSRAHAKADRIPARRRSAGAAAALVAAACATGGVREAELPEAPIAVRYLEPELARRSREAALRRREEGHGDPAALPGRAVADVGELGRYLTSLAGIEQDAAQGGFRRGPEEGGGRVALLYPRTGEIVPVASARRGSAPVDWSADRRRLLFAQRVAGYAQLFEYDLERRQVRPMTREPGAHPWGCYGPGDRLVIASIDFAAQPPRRRIELTDPGGGNPRPLTDGPDDARPACAPDGSAVAWVSGPRGPDARVVLRAPVLTGEPRAIGPGIDPVFTPDGRFVVYAAATREHSASGAPVRDHWRLRRARVGGAGRGPLGAGPLDEVEPAVSPDGRLVAYVVVDERLVTALHVRRLDGSGQRMLFDRGDASGPVW